MKFKKTFASALAATLCITSIPLSAINVAADDAKVYTYDDYTVEYSITNSWGNTDAVNVKITNTGNDPIENWMLYFEPNGDITNIWNAQEATSSGGYTYYKNAGYNSRISTGSYVTFSYFVDDCVGVPEDFLMCQKRAEKSSGYSVSVSEDQSWGNGFNGTITLTNDSDVAIEDWELTFDTNFTITEITSSWSGTMTTLEPYSYMLKGSYTNVIAPHTSVQLGFSGVKNGTPEIISSTLTEVVVDEDLLFELTVLQDDCVDWSELPDSDGDGLPDEYESDYGCNINNPDSDGDGLPDGYEILKVGSDPADAHSLDTTLTDGQFDNDSDSLTNYQEYQLGTDPLVADSDYDGLTDGQEVNIYRTDPLDNDTDDDGISDGDEIALDLNPLLTDSDNDEVLDNKEKFSQNITFDGAESDELVDKVYVAFEGTGYINSTTSIKSVMDVDWMCSNVVGLVGEPYDLSTISEFDEATVTFKIDSTALGNTDFDDLLVLWYDETNQRFVDMDATHNLTDYTLTFTTPHFSKYLIVDCNEWYDAWSENNYPDNETILHTAITIDCSSSTEYSDPNFYRITAANSFVDVMQAADLASVVFFADGASIEQGLTNNQEALHTAINNVFSAGTTNYEAAIQQSMSALSAGHSNASEDIIIFLSDGAPTEIIDGTGVPISPENFDYSIIDDAADAGIKIYTIGLSTPPNSDGETILQEIADRTNGEYYYAATADELVAHFLTINMSKKYDITTDSDEDGLPDLFETYGMPIANGQVIFTDTNDSDADDDGLTDGEEIVMHIVDNEEEVRNAYKYMYDYIPDVFISDNGGIYFEVVTDPTDEDTDGDGILDIDEVKIVGEDGIAARYGVQNTTYYRYTVDEHFYDYDTHKSKLHPIKTVMYIIQISGIQIIRIQVYSRN